MSKTSVFIKAIDFKPTSENVSFGNVDWGSTGYGSVTFKYRTFDLLIKAPRLTSPFGFSKGVPGFANYGRDFNLQFNMESNTEKSLALYEALKKLEEIIVKYAYENRVDWGLYGNQIEAQQATLDDIRAKFTPIIRPPKEGTNYSPTFKVGFRIYYDKETKEPKIITECHNEEGKAIKPSEETIPRRSQCIPIIRGKNIWISPNGRFGVKWQVERLKVYAPEPSAEKNEGVPVQRMISGTCILDSDSEED